MKLLNCTLCHDIVKLQGAWRWCVCGQSAARYLRDGRSAEVWGHGRVLGLDSAQYGKSVANHKAEMGLFVMTDGHPRVRRAKNRPT